LKNAIVFCNRKRDVTTLFRSLERHEYNVGALHGDMDQRTRMMMLDNFRKGNIKLLVASDVAARGLDIPEVSHVFNFDVPINAEDYVHRIGRTGRAGRSGTAFTLVTGDDQKYLDAIEKLIEKSIDWIGEPIDFETAAQERKARRRGGKPAKTTSSSNDNEAEQEKTPAPRRRAPSRSRDTQKPDAPAPVETAPAPAPVASMPQRPVNKKTRNEKFEPAFGAGAHIPAFLLREPRPKKAS
ncbi:MAG: C-terminal helicase domain-containing protein, partial [Roseibium sp.]